jgi:hypothetical protein
VVAQVMSCEVPGAKVEVGKRQFQGGSRQEITLTLGALEQAGEHDGIVTLETNDPEHERIAVPIHMEVASPIKVTPASWFFGFVKPGESKTCTVTISGAVAFQVKEVRVDRPEVLQVTVTAQGDRSYLVEATLQPPKAAERVEGMVEIVTDLAGQPVIKVEYYGSVKLASDAEQTLGG